MGQRQREAGELQTKEGKQDRMKQNLIVYSLHRKKRDELRMAGRTACERIYGRGVQGRRRRRRLRFAQSRIAMKENRLKSREKVLNGLVASSERQQEQERPRRRRKRPRRMKEESLLLFHRFPSFSRIRNCRLSMCLVLERQGNRPRAREGRGRRWKRRSQRAASFDPFDLRSVAN